MKSVFLAAFLILSGISFAQSDSTVVTQDTVDIYVINNTNRLIQTEDHFTLEFRDLKSLKELHYIELDSDAEVHTFFQTCYRVFDKNIELVGQKYTVKRNILSKNFIRVSHHDEAYFMLSYDTVEKMEKAFQRHVKGGSSE